MTQKSLLKRIDDIEEKIRSIVDDLKDAIKELNDLKQSVRTEYTPIYKTEAVEKDIKKFQDLWDLVVKTVLVALVGGVLLLLGLKK